MTAAASDTTAIVTGLSNGISYTCSVVATNSWGSGAEAVTAGDVTPAGVPSRVVDVAAEVISVDGSILISWDIAQGNGAALSGYVITPYDGTTALPPLHVTDVNLIFFTDGTVGAPYTFTVYATNAVGNGEVSQPSPATVFGHPPPGIPTHLRAYDSLGEAVMSWSEPPSASPITGYSVLVYQYDVGTARYVYYASASTAGDTSVGLNLPIGEYEFEVSATSAYGTGPTSAMYGFEY